MAKRIFEIAKELGVESKAIVAKCHAEGISADTVKNHMSSISVGLEATIREWFTTGSAATAIETAKPVDLEKVRARPTRRRAKAKSDQTDDGGSDVAVETLPATGGDESHADSADDEATTSVEEAPAPVAAPEPAAPQPAPQPAARAVTPAPAAPQPPAVAEEPAEAVEEVAEVEEEAAPAPAAASAPAPRKAEPPRAEEPAANTKPESDDTEDADDRPSAQVNVPRRPTVVKPAGPMLAERTPVKLSGPKVVRVEAPEVIEPPRPRRMGPSGGPMIPAARGPRTGGGVGGPTTEDDRGRSPRRKGPGGPGGPGGGGPRRSTGSGVPARRRASGGGGGGDWGGGGQIFSEQDLIEREARLLKSGGFLKRRKQELSRPGQGSRAESAAETGGTVKIAAPFTIRDLSAATGVKAADIVRWLFNEGVMATINSGIEPEKAMEIMMDFDIELEVTAAKTAEESVSEEFEKREAKDLRSRGPVVTILGHVDHGKTSLLDKIRNANVAAGEAGGITQKTSAFRVPVKVAGEEKEVVFLDTPGHEAFTAMRSRGATMTDVVVLVVSAPEGVMPQTIESINHAKAAGVPIVVALNKIDRPDATEPQIQKTLGQLAEHGLNPTTWGGDTEVVRTSATTGEGITELLETLDYQAQLKDLKADFEGAAQGSVVEAKVEEGRGATASILVQQGRLKVGDFVVVGRAFGRIRDISDDRGNKLREAAPPLPVQISGIDEVPDAGDKFYVVDSLKKAQQAAEQRRQRERQLQLAQPKVTLDSLFGQMQDKDTKEILIVLKADLQGTVDVLKSECEKVHTDEVRTRVIHSAIGGITESDVLLADASKAIIIGFNVIPGGKARALAENKGVEIRTYQVIYDIVEDLKKAAEGLLAPELREEILGHAEVRKVFRVSKVGMIAGCYVTDGTVQRDAMIRVTRNGVVIEHDRKLAQLKRVKDDAKEVRAGMECGMKIDGYDDIKDGDVLECYRKVEVKRTL